MATISSISPTTGETLATFNPDSPDVVEDKLAAAATAVPALHKAGLAQRATWMRAAADLLEAEIDDVATLITAEMGKPLAQSRAEVTKSAYAMRFYADNTESFLTGRQLPDAGVVGATQAGDRYEPLGVVLAVMPWNYPIWQVIRFAAPALMAGNAGLLKHASNVPQSALYLGGLFARAGFPTGAFQTLLIGASRVADVIRDPRVAAVTLTGSEGAGRSIGATAGEVLKKTVLELGGSDPFIVMPSANLDEASTVAVKARTSNNGQACINAKRFIVHEAVAAEFTALFADKMRALSVGDPAQADVEVGPLASESGLNDIVELVEDAKAQGVEVLVGGERLPGAGWFYPPTVLAGVTPSMRLWEEEAFGPVASVITVGSLDEALDVANATQFGLGSAFWSQDQDEVNAAVSGIKAGAVFVNGMTISYPELPFGGIKNSGYGRELSMEGMREFCNQKTVWVA